MFRNAAYPMVPGEILSDRILSSENPKKGNTNNPDREVLVSKDVEDCSDYSF
jgi:hypothetical protein